MGGKKKKLIGVLAMLAIAAPLSSKVLADGSDIIELDSIAEYYKTVTFDHDMHKDIAADCADCHHHTTGTNPTDPNCARCHREGDDVTAMACQDCHSAKRFSASYLAEIESNPGLYHVGKPGLKGAYHQKCIGCHKELEVYTGCQDCHLRNDKGDQLFHSGKYAPAPVVHASGH
jgi:hypothetical protein